MIAGAKKDEGGATKDDCGATKDECRRYKGRVQVLQRTRAGSH
jgi:hypothetical protein